jgi:hypothetical protein
MLSVVEERLRPARDQVIPVAGLLVALAIHLGGQIMLGVVSAMALWLVSGIIAWSVEARAFPNDPVRGVHALEWRVKLLNASIYILIFAGAFYGLYRVSITFSNRGFDKFWIGVLSASVAAIVITISLSPEKDKEWAAVHTQRTLEKEYGGMFYGVDQTGNLIRVAGQDTPRWDPRGVESEAVYDYRYAWDEGQKPVNGWDKMARRYRAETLAAGLKKAPIDI